MPCPRRRPACLSGKVRYKTKLDARMALARLTHSRENDRRRERSWYFCLICKGYHLTSQKRS